MMPPPITRTVPVLTVIGRALANTESRLTPTKDILGYTLVDLNIDGCRSDYPDDEPCVGEKYYINNYHTFEVAGST